MLLPLRFHYFIIFIPINPCALLQRSMAFGRREWPKRKAAAENDANIFGLASESYPFQYPYKSKYTENRQQYIRWIKMFKSVITCFFVVNSYLSIISLPKSMGRNSLNVICCISATIIRLASWNSNVLIIAVYSIEKLFTW